MNTSRRSHVHTGTHRQPYRCPARPRDQDPPPFHHQQVERIGVSGHSPFSLSKVQSPSGFYFWSPPPPPNKARATTGGRGRGSLVSNPFRFKFLKLTPWLPRAWSAQNPSLFWRPQEGSRKEGRGGGCSGCGFPCLAASPRAVPRRAPDLPLPPPALGKARHRGPELGAQRHRPRVPGPDAGPPPGLGSRSPLQPTVAAAASQLGQGRPSPPVPRSGEGFALRSRAGYAGRRGREEGALGPGAARRQGGRRRGGGAEPAPPPGRALQQAGSGRRSQERLRVDPTFSAEAGGSGGGWVPPGCGECSLPHSRDHHPGIL